MNKTSLLGGLLGGLMAVVLVLGLGFAWTQAGYEGAAGVAGTITDATVSNLIDDYIRDGRQEVRYRAEVEHFWGDNDTVTDDNGLHRLGSARCYMSNTAPTELSDSHTGIGATTLADYDNSTGASFSGEPDLDDPATNSAAGAEDDVGHGRCWIDLDGPDNNSGTADDNKLYIFIGVAGAGNGAWTAVEAAARPDGDDEVLAGAYNLLYNGSFEAADGTGDVTSNTLPDGWTNGGTVCTHDYNAATDLLYGDGFQYECSGAGGNDAFIYQRLTNLAAGQTYKVLVRAKDDGTGTCTVDTDGASVDMTDDTTTTDAWETLTGTFTTGVALDTVDLRLYRDDDNQTCLFDHAVIYRIDDVDTDRPEISQPGIIAMRDSDNDDGTSVPDTYAAAVPNLSLEFTPPSPGWVIQVGWSIAAEADDPGLGNATWLQCLLNDGVTGDLATTETGMAGYRSGVAEYESLLVTSSYVEPNPVTGTTYTYTVKCEDQGFDMVYNENANGNGNDRYSSLWLIAYPAR